MIKTINLKNVSAKYALKLIRESSVFDYMINWSCNVDEKSGKLIFQLRHGGGDFSEEVQKAVKELDKFIASIDVK